MSITRLFAISAIFVLASLAWLALGTSLVARTGEFDDRLGQEVAQLWGGEHRQVAPRAWVERPRQVTEQTSDGVRDGKAVMRTTTRTVVESGPLPLRCCFPKKSGQISTNTGSPSSNRNSTSAPSI